MTGTSGRQRVQVDLLKNYQVDSSGERMGQFGRVCQPLFKKIKSNSLQLHILSTLRDMLLPKLMRGEIRFTKNFQ